MNVVFFLNLSSISSLAKYFKKYYIRNMADEREGPGPHKIDPPELHRVFQPQPSIASLWKKIIDVRKEEIQKKHPEVNMDPQRLHEIDQQEKDKRIERNNQ